MPRVMAAPKDTVLDNSSFKKTNKQTKPPSIFLIQTI